MHRLERARIAAAELKGRKARPTGMEARVDTVRFALPVQVHARAFREWSSHSSAAGRLPHARFAEWAEAKLGAARSDRVDDARDVVAQDAKARDLRATQQLT